MPCHSEHSGPYIVMHTHVVDTFSGCGGALAVNLHCEECGSSFNRYVDLHTLANTGGYTPESLFKREQQEASPQFKPFIKEFV